MSGVAAYKRSGAQTRSTQLPTTRRPHPPPQLPPSDAAPTPATHTASITTAEQSLDTVANVGIVVDGNGGGSIGAGAAAATTVTVGVGPYQLVRKPPGPPTGGDVDLRANPENLPTQARINALWDQSKQRGGSAADESTGDMAMADEGKCASSRCLHVHAALARATPSTRTYIYRACHPASHADELYYDSGEEEGPRATAEVPAGAPNSNTSSIAEGAGPQGKL